LQQDVNEHQWKLLKHGWLTVLAEFINVGFSDEEILESRSDTQLLGIIVVVSYYSR
jgi:hypothetical protein